MQKERLDSQTTIVVGKAHSLALTRGVPPFRLISHLVAFANVCFGQSLYYAAHVELFLRTSFIRE